MKGVCRVTEKKIKKKKKKVSLGAVGLVLIATGALSVQQGNAAAGVILIILGLAVILMAKYVEE